MILTTHILSGALVGAEMKNPYAVAGLAIALHFALDLLPHGDYLNKNSRLREFWKVALDLAIGFGLVFAALALDGKLSNPFLLRNIFIGIFFSLLPDGTTFLFIWMKMKSLKPLKNFHENLHRCPNGSPERQFCLKNNLLDIFVSLVSLLALIALL